MQAMSTVSSPASPRTPISANIFCSSIAIAKVKGGKQSGPRRLARIASRCSQWRSALVQVQPGDGHEQGFQSREEFRLVDPQRPRIVEQRIVEYAVENLDRHAEPVLLVLIERAPTQVAQLVEQGFTAAAAHRTEGLPERCIVPAALQCRAPEITIGANAI